MPHRARQHAALDIASLADQIVGRIAMADTLDVLVDDRAFIEGAGDVVRGGAGSRRLRSRSAMYASYFAVPGRGGASDGRPPSHCGT